MSVSASEPTRVLHVDDDPQILDLAATFLEREGEDVAVETATDPTEALDRLIGEEFESGVSFDCIVSDYDMPEMNGLDFLEVVREEHPELPFILFTGKGSEEVASEAITAGVSDYLNKGSGTDQYALLANRIENLASRYRTERELQQSTEWMRKLYGGITDAIFVLNEDWEFTHLNDRAEEHLQRSEAELIGEDVWERFPEAADTVFQENYEKAMNQRETVEFETFSQTRDVWLRVRALPIEDGLAVHFRDISEKKERERTLQRQNQHLRTIIENAPIILFALDENGKITLSEGRGLERLGTEPGEFVGESVFDIYAGTSIPEYIRRVIDGEEVNATVPLGDRVYEAWCRPLENDEDIDSRAIGVAIDVTELAERKHRFDAVFDNTSQLMGLLDPDGTVVEINDTALAFSGTDRREIVGRPFWELSPLDLSEGTSDRVKEAVDRAANDEFVRFDEELGSGDDVRTIDTSITPVTDDHGDVEYLVAEGRDITERRERERAIEAQNATMAALHAVTTDLVSCRSVNEVCELTVDAAEEILDFDLCYVGIVEGESIVPRARSASAGPEYARTMSVDEGVAGKTHRTGTSDLTEDIPAANDAEPAQAEYRSAISVPIGERGVFQAVSTEVGWFDETDLELAETLLATVRETIERVEHEEQLRKHEAQLEHERDRFATLFENIPDPVVTVELRNDEPITQSVNEAFEDVFGYDSETVIGDSLDDYIIPSDRMSEAREIDRSVAENEYVEREVRRRTADGELREFLFRSVPIEQGDTTEAFGIYTDITERREAESFRRRLYEITANAEATTDETIERVLELGREYFGMESAYLTCLKDGTQRILRANSPHEALQPGSECPLSEAYCRKTVEMDGPLTVTHAGASGWEGDPAYERFGLEAYVGARLTIDGERYGTVCFADRSPRETEFSELERSAIGLVVRGIESTLERHRYETELERQNEQLGEFASVISHDLRNPLTVANGYLELANETTDNEYFTKIENAHDRMDAIIEDVLTLTRQGERIAETSSVSLTAVAEDAWANVATADAELAVEEDLGTVDADEGRLKQLFENLYRNAIEHAGEDVTIRVGRSPSGFYVEDDGPGVPEKEREKVFEPGYTTGEEGTGMGLSIVETIATAHGWEIEITDGAEDGARFEIQRGMVRGGSKELLLSD